MTGALVLAERRGPVLLLTLNRPERLNAWTDALEDEYFAHLRQAETDPDVRAVVVTGAGRGFSAGADMADLTRVTEEGSDAVSARERPPRTYPLTLRLPLVAAINGAAAGLGLVQALFCDLRFCAPEAKLTTSFARRGLVAEYGVAWLLPRMVGVSTALDLLMSGRVVRGEEARQLGLVDRVLPLDELVDGAVAYATDLALHCSPRSMATIKEQVRRSLDQGFGTAVAEADALMLESFDAPDVAEGVRSYLEKRPPDFAPLPGPAAGREDG
ncbi:MAG TPA: enoyl-CoA hydratase-related protein [Mycobacteriales bacterium]|jgi:enoyl-CoA hydratase/carnithine racemase|nr:enoyl-CoA hydratase-related protein [Mycobacteriales bacterium]